MVDREVIVARLELLRLNVRRLRDVLAAGREAFLAEEDLFLKAERCLQVALQAMLDIGNHLIASEGLARPHGYEDIVPSLARAGLIDAALAKQLRGAAGMRNILVHAYLRIDHELIFTELERDLPSLEEFARQIAALLARQEKG